MNIALLGYLTKKIPVLSFVRREPPLTCCESELTTDTITPLADNRTFIISAFYDPRGPDKQMVRILSIIHHEEVKDLYCWFCCSTTKSLQVSKAHIDMHADRFGFPYVTNDLLCSEPVDCHANHLSVGTSPFTNVTHYALFQIHKDLEPFTANFTVCISTMFGNYSNVLQFIQTMEMYRILGAQKVVIYLNSCSPQVEKVLRYYITQGILEVILWPIERHLRTGKFWHYSMDPKDIGYYGQLATLNDCIYRNKYKSSFVLLNDIDEIILPFHHQTWDSLVDELQQQNPGLGIFLFENHIFPKTVATDGNFSNISSWKDIPGTNILQYVHREPDQVDYFNPRKMIVDPRKVIQTSVHSVLQGLGESINVPLKTALVYHCREPLQEKPNQTSLIEDKTIWQYNASLISNVNTVLNHIHLK
ncbi:uncharacterized protein [Pyxicephalus adspersus]|uniref:uncharacterized protein n=1 Tax=Pyxicephalus adspersus TaxID=30357 RepID=UPI003B5B2735